MARIPQLHEDDPAVTADARAFLAGLQHNYGQVVNVVRAMSNSPESAEAFWELLCGAYMLNTNLQQKQLELAFFTATALNECYYCIRAHTAFGRDRGLSEAQMRHMTDDPLPPDVYDEAEAAIVRYAQKSTRLEPIDDATYAALAKHFTAHQMVDLSLTVGLSHMINRFVATFLIDVDPEIIANLESGDAVAGGCPVPRPTVPK